MTTPRFDHDWERRLHEELRKLPDHGAPADLVPDVMAVIRARQGLAWYQRPATAWPPLMRAAFGVAALALLCLFAWGVYTFWPTAPIWTESQMLAGLIAKIAALKEAGHGLLEAGSLVLSTLLTPMRLAILGAIVASQLALVGLGSAAWRSALRPHLR